jgi:hypothetical protein
MLYTQGKYVFSTFDCSFFAFFARGFKDFTLVERPGQGKRSTTMIGEVDDDMALDLVVFNKKSIHSNTCRQQSTRIICSMSCPFIPSLRDLEEDKSCINRYYLITTTNENLPSLV